jgi:hypothetical protein
MTSIIVKKDSNLFFYKNTKILIFFLYENKKLFFYKNYVRIFFNIIPLVID